MSKFGTRCAVVLIGTMCAGWFSTAAALDPLVLLLLRMIRDSTASSAIEAGVGSMTAKPALQPEATLPRLATLPQSEGQWLKQLIDESFIHLSSAQREELFASLTRMLNDPRYVQSRSLILAEFTGQAIALRDAHRRLAGLTPDQMRAIAVEARQEYERLPVSQREQMLQVLQHGIPGMPRTLNDMMLAEFGNARPVAR